MRELTVSQQLGRRRPGVWTPSSPPFAIRAIAHHQCGVTRPVVANPGQRDSFRPRRTPCRQRHGTSRESLYSAGVRPLRRASSRATVSSYRVATTILVCTAATILTRAAGVSVVLHEGGLIVVCVTYSLSRCYVSPVGRRRLRWWCEYEAGSCRTIIMS